jgi:hypothetical protein
MERMEGALTRPFSKEGHVGCSSSILLKDFVANT